MRNSDRRLVSSAPTSRRTKTAYDSLISPPPKIWPYVAPFSKAYRYTWRSPQQTESQIDYVLIDGRHFSDIIDVRTYRGANIDSDHYLVMVKLRPKFSVINNVRYWRGPSRGLLEYSERSHQRRSREWFDEECRTVLEEKNAASSVMLQQGTQQNVERYKQKRRQLFREKKRHLEEAECKEIELLCRSQETRKFYQKLNASRNGFVPQAELCRDKDGGSRKVEAALRSAPT
ncbi:uncharacterized protein LOC109427478 [Aedes albopictus]|uniref:Endonuclease/exonuclease/phosphatase domain-containing protein n=1 Tax=Aedes albopictus TaxID=7160 RepID=A0ABM1ZHI5_AEDAL